LQKRIILNMKFFSRAFNYTIGLKFQTMIKSIKEQLGAMDIYLIDQLMKSRIIQSSKILDAGYGRGRNMEYFIRNNFNIYGIDHNPDYKPIVIEKASSVNPDYNTDRIITGKVEDMPYDSENFDFIFSIAVLHFAKSHDQFHSMLNELLRVLKPGGYLMFRMTSWHTFDLFPKNESGIITIKDGDRYMLDIENLKIMLDKNKLKLADPIKTTNVDGHRTMTTVVIEK
jgi:SAM-dependent methyltransferase